MTIDRDESRQSFPRLLAIFFAVFHPQAGPSVIYQVPPDFVGSTPNASSNSSQEHFFCVNMDSISEYLIPKRQLCDRMISICNSGYRILGWPVRVEGPQYERNAFIFNCCIVFDESDDVSAYIPVVRRLARVFKNIEEMKKSLSSETERRVVQDVIQQVLEDLNGYGECRIPIVDDEVTLNIKLFSRYPHPRKVKDWHVPVPLMSLKELVSDNWDLTMQRVVPYIDGLSSIRRISQNSDVDPTLVAKCLEHLVYYNCLMITDIFQFNAIYSVTPDLNMLNLNTSIQVECCEYVSSSVSENRLSWASIFELYASLHQAMPLKDWMKIHFNVVRHIDLRRFINFGITRGFLYRVHMYPYLAPENRRTKLASIADGTRHLDDICTSESKSHSEILAALGECGTVELIGR